MKRILKKVVGIAMLLVAFVGMIALFSFADYLEYGLRYVIIKYGSVLTGGAILVAWISIGVYLALGSDKS